MCNQQIYAVLCNFVQIPLHVLDFEKYGLVVDLL